MSWSVDEVRLGRVRQAMERADLDVLVVRAPDNVHYLTNYWPMKGWEVAIFPRSGKPTLVAVEPQHREVADTAWTDDVVLFRGFDPGDARPPYVRALDAAVAAMKARGHTGKVGVELSHGVQAPERMTGEPTVFWEGWFEALRAVAKETMDCASLLAEERMIKTDQEIERLRLTNRLAGEAVAHVREQIRPGMPDAGVAALYESYVHTHGIGYEGRARMARAFVLAWSGPSIRTFTQTQPTRVLDDAPTMMEIWTCVDGYWNDLTKSACPGKLSPEWDGLLDTLLDVFDEVTARLGPGARLADLDGLIRRRVAAAGYEGQPPHFVIHGVGSRAHEPPWAHPRSDAVAQEGMVLAVEPGIYWEGGGGLRLEDDFLVTGSGAEKLCPAPEDFRQ